MRNRWQTKAVRSWLLSALRWRRDTFLFLPQFNSSVHSFRSFSMQNWRQYSTVSTKTINRFDDKLTASLLSVSVHLTVVDCRVARTHQSHQTRPARPDQTNSISFHFINSCHFLSWLVEFYDALGVANN